MEIAFRVCLFITGVINFLPSLIAIWPWRISKMYGVEVPDTNMELLLRHRAVLFAIIGGFMIYAVFTESYYDEATLFGLLSMSSFILLYQWVVDPVNRELTKVMWIDVAGVGLLLFGYVLHRFA